MYGVNIIYERIIRKAERLYDFAFDVFDWVIDKLYPVEQFQYINCSFFISPIELRNNVGSRIYGDTRSGVITIYLYNIICDNISLNNNEIKVLLMSVITHELFHLNQNTFKDNKVINSFKIDDNYYDTLRFIEIPVINKTIEFLDVNMYEICKKFNIKYDRYTIEYFNIPSSVYMMRTDTYIPNTPAIFWMDIIRDLMNKKELDLDLLDSIESDPTVSINVKYNGYRNFKDDDAYIKLNNEYCSPSGELMSHIRELGYGMDGEYRYTVYELKDKSRLRIEIEYTLKDFKPIKRIEE